jgi:predicted phage-related endonuclease
MSAPATADRSQSLGASDAAAVVDRDPWRTPADVWLEKTRRVGPVLRASPAMEAGTFLQDGILDWAAHALGMPLACRQWTLIHPTYPELSATLDAVADDGSLLEAKTSGLVGGAGAHLDAWGDAGTDDVPIHVLLQVHHQFAVAAAQPDWPAGREPRRCYVPALLARRGLVLFAIERTDALVEALVDRERQFWRDYVVGDRCPPDSLPSLAVLARLAREPATTVEIPAAVVLDWQAAKATLKEAEAAESAARRALLAALGTAEAGTCALGTVSYLERHRRGYEVAAATYRQLTWKPADGRQEATA